MAKVHKSEAAVFRLLELKYPENQYALFSQVADSTGREQSRWADAIAFGLWPSRGLEIEGFEIKVTRSDWLQELNDHTKSSAIQKYCHRWWIVTGARDIVKPNELPATWGLIVPRGENSLQVKVKAPLLKPKRISRGFCAAVMRRARESHINHLKCIKADLYKEVEESAKKHAVFVAKREIDEETYDLRNKIRSLELDNKQLNRNLSFYKSIESVSGVDFHKINFYGISNIMASNMIDDGARAIDSAIFNVESGLSRLEDAIRRSSKIREAISEIVSKHENDGEAETESVGGETRDP